MKKLAPTKQSEALKLLFRNPGTYIAERAVPGKKKANSMKMAWFAGDSPIKLSDSTVNKMEEKGWIKASGDGKYELDEEGRALAEMMCGQKEYDFSTKIWMQVKSYDEDPLKKPDLKAISFDDKKEEKEDQ